MTEAAAQTPQQRNAWAMRFLRGVLIWILPAVLLWLLITPFYNLFLTRAAENLVRLTESPSVTRLQIRETHYFVITRSDLPTSRGFIESVRVTDTHFPLIMLFAFFLATPGISWRRKLETLGWSVLIAIFFHMISLLLWVKFVYATQLGDWSVENYSPLARNAWGLAKHLADLPFKFSLPVLLWAAFHLRELLGASR